LRFLLYFLTGFRFVFGAYLLPVRAQRHAFTVSQSESMKPQYKSRHNAKNPGMSWQPKVFMMSMSRVAIV
jgi:hypothetical protein